MLLGHDILPLTPLWERDNPVVLVSPIKAMALCREEGCEKLPARESLRHFDAMDRMSSWRVRQFVSEARLNRMFLGEMNDWELTEMLRNAIKTGDLVVLRKSGKTGKAPDATAEQRRLVKEIEQQTRGRMNYAGRPYKLVADVDLGKMPGRSSYEVVGRDAAQRVLEGLAKQMGTAGDLSVLLAQASAKLTRDWSPPFSEPDGLILLRGIPASRTLPQDQEPALTPSQLQQLMQPKADAWLKIRLIDVDDKKAIPNASIRLKLPQATVVAPYSTDVDGFVDVTVIPSGTFNLESIEDDQVWEMVSHDVS